MNNPLGVHPSVVVGAGAALGLVGGVAVGRLADWLPGVLYGAPAKRRSLARRCVPILFCVMVGAALGWQYVAVWEAWFRLVCCAVLLLVALIDLEHGLVPNVLVFAGSLWVLLFQLLPLASRSTPALVTGWRSALIGAALGGGGFVLLALLGRGALGAGDVKLAWMIGWMTGYPGVVQALVLGIVLGGVGAALLMLLRVRKPREYMPYAPYLAAGGISVLLCGPRMAGWLASLL